MAKRIISKIVFIYIIISMLSIYANDGVIYDFTEQELNWVGENVNLDYISYDPDEEAYKATLYNIGWASRFGGVAIQGNDLELTVSATKNRFVKIMAKVDEIGKENAFDKLLTFYWFKGDPNVTYGTVALDTLSALYGSEDYITITFDLGWTNEEDKVIEKFRMDMFSSTIEKAATTIDGGQCGYMWMKYIAFFDTKEQADAYELVIPTQEPATPTPEATVKPTPTSTAVITPTPVVKDKEVNYTPYILIGVVVVVAVIAVILIIFVPKGKKGNE